MMTVYMGAGGCLPRTHGLKLEVLENALFKQVTHMPGNVVLCWWSCYLWWSGILSVDRLDNL